MPTREQAWDDYLAAYHKDRPGITETAFVHAADPEVGSAHDWLARALPFGLGAVLDVACGNAALQPRLSGYDRYLGIDRSEPELALARLQGRGPVVAADARALPVPDGRYDTVVSSMGLMLIKPFEDAVAEIARVLRPGGSLGLLLPAVLPLRPSDLRPLFALSLPLHGPGSMPQLLGRRRLSAALDGEGLDVVSLDTRRFGFPLRTGDDARLAVRALYTPGRRPHQLQAAERSLRRRVGPRAELGVPLLRVVARRR